LLTLQYLRESLDYDPATGVLTWRVRPSHHFEMEHRWKAFAARWAGKPAGSLNYHGYLNVGIDGRLYKANRIAFSLHHCIDLKDVPPQLDHIDGDRVNNRADNLRAVTHAQNQHNAGRRSDNASGFKGVSWQRRGLKWAAQIRVKGKKVSLGHFDTPEAAHAAYCEAAKFHHGEFAKIDQTTAAYSRSVSHG
jgi:hypothetical protein